jgi:peptidyl-prolyl cis-trans isomerase D
MALGFMRRHRRWLFVFLWVVIAAFIILYIPAFRGAGEGGPGDAVGTVGGEPITVGEFRQAYTRQVQMYERLYRGRMDRRMLRSLGIEDQVFQALVLDRLTALEASRLGVEVTDEELEREIAQAPQFQRDGKFIGTQEIRRLIELQGSTAQEFEAEFRRSLVRDRLEALIAGAASVADAEVDREYRRRNEQVRAEYVRIEASQAGLDAGDGEIQAQFEKEKDSYRLPEKRAVSFALVDETALRARVTVTDRDAEGYYQENRDEFREEEQACASHVLIKVKADAAEKDGHPDAEAKALADKLLGAIRGGEDFAAVARKSSEDPGSASRGGDLGCFPRGRMLPEFEGVAFSMEAGEVAGPVRTSLGYHIIRLASLREETIPPVGQVKDRIRDTLLAQRTDALVEEQVGALSALLSRGQSLEDAARTQGVPLQKTRAFARGETVEPLASPQLGARTFQLGKVGDVDREGFAVPKGFAFVALAEIQPSRVPDLKEIRDQVRRDVIAEQARRAALQRAEQLRARAAASDLEKAATEMKLVRKETSGLVSRGQAFGDLPPGAALDEAAFALAEKALSEPIPVEGGYAVLRVLEKKGPDPAALDTQRAGLARSLRDERRNQTFQAYLSHLRQRYKVERFRDAFQRQVG